MDLARPREGHVDIWVRLVVLLAVGSTLAILISGPRVVWLRDGDEIGVSRFWFENTLAIGFAVMLAVACAPPARGSRFVRLAVVVPVLQIVAMFVAFTAWQLLRSRMPSANDAMPLLERLPVSVVLPWIAFATAGGAWLVARQRRREWLHATVMVALVNTLLLGLWVPIASNVWKGRTWDRWAAIEHSLDRPARMAAFLVVPPFVAALVFTATALRWPRLWRRNTGIVGALLMFLLVYGVALRLDVVEIGAFVYLNFMHVMLATAIVAATAIAVLGIVTWIATARARRLLDQPGILAGTIVSRAPIATLELTSWLVGLRQSCAAFVVETADGEVPVPAGAYVVAPTPLATTLLRGGEIVHTLQPGDRVALAGYVRVRTDGPFRTTSAPIPGADGITVGRLSDERYGFAHVALDLWRPSIAYLLILVAAALPGLAALLTKQL